MPLIDGTVLRPRDLDFDEPDSPEAEWDAFGSPKNLQAAHTNVWRRFLSGLDRRGVGGDAVPMSDWVADGVWAEAKQMADQLKERVEAAGRFDPYRIATPGKRVRLVPGDAAELRWVNVAGTLTTCSMALETWGREMPNVRDPALPLRVASDVGGALKVVDAQPFFLPDDWADALLASDPPDEETMRRVRLPFESCLCFFDEVPVTELIPVDDDGQLPSVTVLGDEQLDLKQVGLVSVSLWAGADGVGIEPWFHLGLVAEAPLPSGEIEKAYIGSWGLMSESVLGHLGANLAGLLTWGSWADPVERPSRLDGLVPGSRDWRRTLRAGAVRRAEPHGTLDQVRVVDLKRILGSRPAGGDADPNRTVSTHLRRGHWRRVRVAVRDSAGDTVGPTTGEHAAEGETFVYEGRWIPPTLVNPDGGNAGPDRVYRIPRSDRT